MKKPKTYFVHDTKTWLRVKSFTANAAAGEFRKYYDENLNRVYVIELVPLDDPNKFLFNRLSLPNDDLYIEWLLVVIKAGPQHPNYPFAAQAFITTPTATTTTSL